MPDPDTQDQPSDDGIDTTLPPFVVKMLRQGYTVEPIRLDRNGRWWHRGNPIDHPKIARLFGGNIGKTKGGTWVLEIGRFTYPIQVDDTPLFVKKWRLTDNGELELDLNTGEALTISADRLAHDEHGLLAMTDRGFWARFDKAPYMRFVEAHVTPDGEDFLVTLNGKTTPLALRDQSE